MSSQQERLTAFQSTSDRRRRHVDASAWKPGSRARRCDDCGAHVPPGRELDGAGCVECRETVRKAIGMVPTSGANREEDR